jgi:hypothetical protein
MTIEKSLSNTVFVITGINQMKEQCDFNALALLTRKEKEWLLGRVQVSNTIKRDLKYRIRKKLEIFQNQEVPLLIKSGFFEDKNDYDYAVTSNSYIDSNVVANDDGVVTNHDTPSHWGRWSSLVKIPPQTWPKLRETEHNSQNKERLQAHLQLNGPGRIRTNDPRHVKAVS